MKINQVLFQYITTDGGVLFEVLPAYIDVFHQALACVGPSLFNRVLSTQSKHCHIFQWQTEAAQAPVQLLSKTLSYLVALILKKG